MNTPSNCQSCTFIFVGFCGSRSHQSVKKESMHVGARASQGCYSIIKKVRDEYFITDLLSPLNRMLHADGGEVEVLILYNPDASFGNGEQRCHDVFQSLQAMISLLTAEPPSTKINLDFRFCSRGANRKKGIILKNKLEHVGFW